MEGKPRCNGGAPPCALAGLIVIGVTSSESRRQLAPLINPTRKCQPPPRGLGAATPTSLCDVPVDGFPPLFGGRYRHRRRRRGAHGVTHARPGGGAVSAWRHPERDLKNTTLGDGLVYGGITANNAMKIIFTYR